jgi:hypothetical protein
MRIAVVPPATSSAGSFSPIHPTLRRCSSLPYPQVKRLVAPVAPKVRKPDIVGASTKTYRHNSWRAVLVVGLSLCPVASFAAGSLDACQFYPDNHIFNTPIDALFADTDTTIDSAGIATSTPLHLDFDGADPANGIPYNVFAVTPTTTWTPITITESPDESDCGDGSRSNAIVHGCNLVGRPTMPIPPNPNVEGEAAPGSGQGTGDSHLLVLDSENCFLWEAYGAVNNSGAWSVQSLAFWDLSKNDMRPAGWTSADAAGFPILPLLARADEANTGAITHALRFTLPHTAQPYVWPASHQAGSSGLPIGTLLRLKASYVIPDTDSTQSKALLQAMQTYGMYLADNGGPSSGLYVQLDPSAVWDTDSITTQVQAVTLSDFEVVNPLSLRIAANSYAAIGNDANGGGTGGAGSTAGSTGANATGGDAATTGSNGSIPVGSGSTGGTASDSSNGSKGGCSAGGHDGLALIAVSLFLFLRKRVN